MTEESFTHLFTMSAFEALLVIRSNPEYVPGCDVNALVNKITMLGLGEGGLNFIAGVELERIVPHSPGCISGQNFYRQCVEHVILTQFPVWLKIIALGRQKFTQKLARDEQQCFREAGLLVDPPTPEVIYWWDKVAGRARLHTDQVKLERARKAEQLSLEYERERLKHLGIQRDPKWIAIEDNTAGYDVLSYDVSGAGLVNRLIEVKSTIVSPLRFYLTRNEWDQALTYRESYIFQVWNMQGSPPRMHEFTTQQILKHVPVDNASGRWQSALIPVEQ